MVVLAGVEVVFFSGGNGEVSWDGVVGKTEVDD